MEQACDRVLSEKVRQAYGMGLCVSVLSFFALQYHRNAELGWKEGGSRMAGWSHSEVLRLCGDEIKAT